MNYLKNMIVVCLLLAAHSVELFGAVSSRGVGSNTAATVKQTAAGSSVSTQRAGSRGTPTTTLSARTETKATVPAGQPVNVHNAVAILNNYAQKRADFIKEVEMASSALLVVNSAARTDRKMKEVAVKFEPILYGDKKIMGGLSDEDELRRKDIAAKKDLFVRAAQAVLEGGDKNDLIETARDYLSLDKRYVDDIEVTLKKVFSDGYSNTLLRDAEVKKLMAKITEPVLVVSDKITTLINELDAHWVTFDNGSIGPSNEWFDRLIVVLEDLSKNTSQQEVDKALAFVRESLGKKYKSIFNAENALLATNDFMSYVTNKLGQVGSKSGEGVVTKPELKPIPKSKGWWSWGS